MTIAVKMVLVAPSSEDEKSFNEMSPGATWLLSSELVLGERHHSRDVEIVADLELQTCSFVSFLFMA